MYLSSQKQNTDTGTGDGVNPDQKKPVDPALPTGTGNDEYIEIDSLTELFGDGIKVKSFTSSATEPAASEVVARHVIIDTNLDDLKNINRSGKVVIDVMGRPEQFIMGSNRRKSKILRACWNEQYLNQRPNFKKPVMEVLGNDKPNQRFFIIEVEKKA